MSAPTPQPATTSVTRPPGPTHPPAAGREVEAGDHDRSGWARQCAGGGAWPYSMLGGPPHPWHDEALTVGQRICAALAAGLELGERLTDLAWRTEAGQRERLAWQAGYEHACQDARLDVMRRRGAAWQAGYAHGFAEGYTAARDDATHRDTPDHTHDGYRCVGGAR